jgi:hypothetical protein
MVCLLQQGKDVNLGFRLEDCHALVTDSALKPDGGQAAS